MSNNKQSSVEYLMDKLFDPSSMVKEQLEWFEQSKAMHKEEIENAVTQGWDYNEEGLVRWMGEKYYNKIFNIK